MKIVELRTYCVEEIMVAYCSSQEEKLKLLPGQPHWFFLVLAFGIGVAVACKAHTKPLELSAPSILLVQNSSGEKKKSNRGGAPSVGRKAAEKYFRDVPGQKRSAPRVQPRSDHFLALHFGGYIDGKAFSWGESSKVNGAGRITAGVTYRIGEWVRSMDLLFRMDVNNFDLPEGDALKISVLPLVQFPEASSGFPLYFGLGLGPGIFTQQIGDSSDLSIDYQLFGGARFFNLFRSTGLFIESGIKNHFHVLSSGQFNGFFLSAGTVFTF